MIDLKSEASLRAAIERFYFAYREFTAGADRLLEQRGLSRVHHRILYFIGRQPDLSMKDLLGVLAITKQALHAPLRQLIEMGLIVAGGDEADGRVRRLRLSGEGVRLEARLTATQTALLATAFGQAGAAGAAGWFAVMEAVAGSAPATDASSARPALSAATRSASRAVRRPGKALPRRAD